MQTEIPLQFAVNEETPAHKLYILSKLVTDAKVPPKKPVIDSSSAEVLPVTELRRRSQATTCRTWTAHDKPSEMPVSALGSANQHDSPKGRVNRIPCSEKGQQL